MSEAFWTRRTPYETKGPQSINRSNQVTSSCWTGWVSGTLYFITHQVADICWSVWKVGLHAVTSKGRVGHQHFCAGLTVATSGGGG